MSNTKNKSYIGGDKWRLSDQIYFKLTGREVKSKYNPIISVFIKELPDFLPGKTTFGLFWSTPTFKDIDSQYFFHVFDDKKVDFVISTSSANTVEGMARTIKQYNQEAKKNIKAILLVPELSSYKVDKNVLQDNSHIQYVVLKNSTLDSVREFALKLQEKMIDNHNVVTADVDLKTAAYSQIGFVLNEINLINEDVCFIQTVSGGVGPVGFIESAYKLKSNPEILLVQPRNGKSAPIVDALIEHSSGNDPLSIFKDGNYETSSIEPTLGSTRPVYSIKKFIKWRENSGRIYATQIAKDELFQYKKKILKALVKVEIYQNEYIGQKLYDLEKSGFLAFTGAIKNVSKIESNTIIVNFTGRTCYDFKLPISATPHIIYDPTEGIENFMKLLA